MADMTDEEYDALDERWTRTTPKIDFSRPGVFAMRQNFPPPAIFSYPDPSEGSLPSPAGIGNY